MVVVTAVAHTPEGTPARVAVAETAGGPGLPADFQAHRGASRGGSTGLGLDIARRTAEAAGGGLRLAAGPLGGTRVELSFGPPA